MTTVKPLDWCNGHPGTFMLVAESVLGLYMAWEINRTGVWSLGSLPGKLVDGGIEAAKSAAFADYSARIMSAVEPAGVGGGAAAPSSHVAAGLLARWREGEFENTADEAAQAALDRQSDSFDAAPVIEAWLTALSASPAGVKSWGEMQAEDCVLSIGSKRTCGHGTLGCVNHHAPPLLIEPAGVGVETPPPQAHVAFLTMWAADIRASSGVSVDADSLESAAEAIATLSAEKERLAAELHDWRSGGAVTKLLGEIEVMRDTLSFIVTECKGASRCREHEFGLEVISKVASNALALVGPPPVPAALKGDEPAGVVKPLEWSPAGSGRWRAQAPIGSYDIWHQWVSDGKFHVSVHTGPYTDLTIGKGFPTLEEAQAAAFSDYSARIMSAIEPAGVGVETAPPSTHVAGKAEAFDKIVAARKKHVDAVAAYNNRLTIVRSERERGNHSLRLDDEYEAMSEAHAKWHRTCQELADAARAIHDKIGGGG